MTPQDWNKVIDMVVRCVGKAKTKGSWRYGDKVSHFIDADAFLQALEAEREEMKCVQCGKTTGDKGSYCESCCR